MSSAAAQTEPQDILLDDFNQKQIATNRLESTDVKKCFTEQCHQTLMLAVGVLGLGLPLLFETSAPALPLIALGSILTVILCLATADIGCHKFATSNRIAAYQIHLSRTRDYLAHNGKRRYLAEAIRRLDWEESLFAWRVVQPVIHSYFYLEVRYTRLEFGRFFKRTFLPGFVSRWLLPKRFESNYSPWSNIVTQADMEKPEESKQATGPQKQQEEIAEDVNKYPWYDTNELLKMEGFRNFVSSTKKWPEMQFHHAAYHPGTYLEKVLRKLHSVSVLCCFIFALTLIDRFELDGTATALKSHLIGVTLEGTIGYSVALGVMILCVAHSIWWHVQRCRMLESGLLSIQTGAFVWRIITITALVARTKLAAIRSKDRDGQPANQLYNGYTRTLAWVASTELRNNLHRIHVWLEEQEYYLEKHLSENSAEARNKKFRQIESL